MDGENKIKFFLLNPRLFLLAAVPRHPPPACSSDLMDVLRNTMDRLEVQCRRYGDMSQSERNSMLHEIMHMRQRLNANEAERSCTTVSSK